MIRQILLADLLDQHLAMEADWERFRNDVTLEVQVDFAPPLQAHRVELEAAQVEVEAAENQCPIGYAGTYRRYILFHPAQEEH